MREVPDRRKLKIGQWLKRDGFTDYVEKMNFHTFLIKSLARSTISPAMGVPSDRYVNNPPTKVNIIKTKVSLCHKPDFLLP
jgi:hypothetical protein